MNSFRFLIRKYGKDANLNVASDNLRHTEDAYSDSASAKKDIGHETAAHNVVIVVALLLSVA